MRTSFKTRLPLITVVFALLAATAVVRTASADTAPTCTSPAKGQPMFITEKCVDPRFNEGYVFIAIDEVRQAPVPHRFIYGGFKGTDARFAFYFPSADQYQERFFQGPLHQVRLPGEFAFPNEANFAFDSGGYLIETNNGGYESCLNPHEQVAKRCDPTIRGYRVAAAAAKFSRVMAEQIYGTTRRPYGYLYGGSGGAYQSLSSAEQTRGVWDGFLPFVMGDPYALLAHFEVPARAVRLLGDKYNKVADAMAPGGSGNAYAGLTKQQAAAVRELARFGFPLRALRFKSYTGPSFITAEYIWYVDPDYPRDFWSKPGYLGTAATPEGAALRKARFSQDATVIAAAPQAPSPVPPPPATPYDALGPAYTYYMVATITVSVPPKVYEIDNLPSGDLTGAMIDVLTGPSRGMSCPLKVVDANAKLIQCGNSDPKVINGIGPGDRLRISNSWGLAYETQFRHDLPPASWHVGSYEQFRDRNGKPLYPQRSVSPAMAGAPDAAGSIATGKFYGKMLILNTLLDTDAFPYPAEWYRQQAAKYGRSKDLRIWFADNANHGAGYLGILEQGLRDLAAWVEKGKPPATMRYTVDRDNQVHLPPTAAARGGVQPVIDLTVKGKKRVAIKAGDTVTLKGTITVPPGTGKVVCAEWDPEGSGGFTTTGDVLPAALEYDPQAPYMNAATPPNPNCQVGGTQQKVELAHTYSEAGTYFAALKGTSQRDGDATTPFARAENIDQVRVVVH